MKELAAKVFTYPVNGDYKGRLTLKQRWDGACIVEYRDSERGIHDSSFLKAFKNQVEAMPFFNSKLLELS